ncbi:penicillin acylase family protein [Actinocorallia libanotica]|uniref:Penicillin acylase family protein n=2 Tax=Actinocorallia libanotica TaxID=46162 RepID=A0ABP4CAW4_9ACTN
MNVMRRWPRPLRWGARILALLLVLALVAALWVVWTVRRSFPDYGGEVRLAGLSAPVTVHRDAHGVPQVYADTPEDLFKAQGYVTAQDRFWEMDFRRHVTSGRLSELFGETTLETDKVVRTLGWRRVAEQELALLEPETVKLLEAYASGVNAWLDEHPDTSDQALEYAVLGIQRSGYRPERWSPADSVAWLKAMAWDLRSNMDDELGRALAGTRLPAERVDQLYPAYDDERMPVIVGDTEKSGEKPSGTPVQAPARALSSVLESIRAMPEMLGNGASEIGSNSWVVSGSRTATGKPLLANDPHLAPQMPSVWYQAGLHCRKVTEACPYDVTGFTFSGLPGVVIGHNHRVAWGFTNLGPDVTDLYVERIDGQNAEYKGEKEPLQVREETIKVAGGQDVRLSVRATRHGPIISDVLAKSAKLVSGSTEAIAMRWTALDPGRTADAVFQMNRATDWKSFREAAASFEVPSQNLVYADVDGNIGYQSPGRIPVRSKGDGTRPVPGWDGEHEWTGFLPYEELPSIQNPEKGYIVTANNAVVGSSYEHLLTKDWSYGYRAARIDELLKGDDKIDVAGMADVQLDSRNGFAPVLVPHLQRVGSGLKGVDLLDGWDFTQPVDSAAAAFYNAAWRHLVLLTFNDDLPEGARPDGGDRWFEVVRTLLDDPADPYWDDVSTPAKEDRDTILKSALRAAAAELTDLLGDTPSAWRWGDLHTLTVTNQTFGTSGIAPVERLFNRGPLHLPGGQSIVNATGWDAQEGYAVDWVPSMRMVVDLADLDASRYINLTGASGHPFTDHYWDQTSLWAEGKTIPWRSTPALIEKESRHTLTLKP